MNNNTRSQPERGWAPTSAAAVANEFINLGLNEPTVPPVDQMKLQKLLFYAQAWYLAHCDRSLFDEDFEAWPWGPVVSDIYAQTYQFGRKPINAKMLTMQETDDGSFKFLPPEEPSTELKEFIQTVWASLKHYTGVQLSNSTHAEGEPWTIVKRAYKGDLSHRPSIPNKLIEAVFKKKLKHDSGSTQD